MSGIRALSAADADAVLRLNADAGDAVFRLDAAEYARLLGLSTRHRAACDSAGRLIGYALAFAREDAYDGEEFHALRVALAAPFLYIDQVVVAAPARARGVGRALYDALAAQCLAAGAFRLCCEVNTAPPNPASLAFHRRMGFRILGGMDTADGRRVALLQRDLLP